MRESEAWRGRGCCRSDANCGLLLLHIGETGRLFGGVCMFRLKGCEVVGIWKKNLAEIVGKLGIF